MKTIYCIFAQIYFVTKTHAMKKYIFRFTRLISIVFFMFIVSASFAQGPPDPPTNPGSGGGSDLPVGGSAPIDGGLSIFLLLGSAYGTYRFKKSN